MSNSARAEQESDAPSIEGPIYERDKYGHPTGQTYYRCSGCDIEAMREGDVLEHCRCGVPEMATSDNISTPATTLRSVRAACEGRTTAKLADGLYLVDTGKLGDDGCKHIRRVRMVRGDIDLDPLLEADADVDNVLLRSLGEYDE
jgi:hypothetical protein